MPNCNMEIMRKSYKTLRAFCEIASDEAMLNCMNDKGLNNILTDSPN